MKSTYAWRTYSVAVFIQFVINAYFFPRGFRNSEGLIYSSRTAFVSLWAGLERIANGLFSGYRPLLMSSLILVILGLALAHFGRQQNPPLPKVNIFVTILMAGLPLIGIAFSMLCFVVALSGA